MWYVSFFLLLNVLSHEVQGDSYSVWTDQLCCESLSFAKNCFPQTLQTKLVFIFEKYDVLNMLLPGRLSVMYWLFHNRVYLVSDAWKIIHNVGAKKVLLQLFYFGQKDSVCWGEDKHYQVGIIVDLQVKVFGQWPQLPVFKLYTTNFTSLQSITRHNHLWKA